MLYAPFDYCIWAQGWTATPPFYQPASAGTSCPSPVARSNVDETKNPEKNWTHVNCSKLGASSLSVLSKTVVLQSSHTLLRSLVGSGPGGQPLHFLKAPKTGQHQGGLPDLHICTRSPGTTQAGLAYWLAELSLLGWELLQVQAGSTT